MSKHEDVVRDIRNALDREPTPGERGAQRISFVSGQVACNHPEMDRETARLLAEIAVCAEYERKIEDLEKKIAGLEGTETKRDRELERFRNISSKIAQGDARTEEIFSVLPSIVLEVADTVIVRPRMGFAERPEVIKSRTSGVRGDVDQAMQMSRIALVITGK